MNVIISPLTAYVRHHLREQIAIFAETAIVNLPANLNNGGKSTRNEKQS